MPIQYAIWKVGAQPTPLSLGKLASEQALEDMIVREPGIRGMALCARTAAPFNIKSER